MNIIKEYELKSRKKYTLIGITFFIMIILAFYSTTLGTADIKFTDVLSSIQNIILNKELSKIEKIILYLRMPRITLALLAGMGLAVSGTVMQSITKNPLVSPFTIGISSAAAFGASLAIVFNIGIKTDTRVGIFLTAFAMAMLCGMIVYLIAAKVGLTPETLILTGIALNYLFGALTATIQFFAKEHQLSSVVSWTFGSFNGANWQQCLFLLILLIIILPIFQLMANKFNIIATNEDEVVIGLGVNPKLLRIIAGILSVLISSAIISFTGIIGFVGLVAPHIARFIVGSDHKYLILFSAISGAILLILSDTIGRVLLDPIMIPVGIIVSYLGVPIFINLIITRKKGYFR